MSLTVVNDGPHDAALDGLTVKLIFAGLLTLVLRVTLLETGGAHLKESVTLPELAVPPLPENCIVTGFVDQSALGAPAEANPTAK